MGPGNATLQGLQRFDELACIRLNRTADSAAVLRLFRTVSRLGDGPLWYALMLGLLAVGGREAVPGVLTMAATGLVCLLFYKVLKRRMVRPRPFEVLTHVRAGIKPLDRFSFPSGHTLHAVGFTLVATTVFPGLAVPLWLFTALVALSRVVLGLHYPSDVLAGAALGAAIAQAALFLAGT